MTPHPVFDLAEIAEEAAERAAIDFRAGYALRTARRSLELLSIEWANRGFNLWTIEGPRSITCTPGRERYALPEDTVDIVEHAVRTWQSPDVPGGTPELSYERWSDWGAQRYIDMPLTRITVSDYAAIPNKEAMGRPTLIHIRRDIRPYFVLWMVPPPIPLYQIVIWRLRRMRSLGEGGEGEPEIPWRFIPAMVAGLAYYMALKSPDPAALQRVPLLKSSYEEQFQFASDEDRDRASFHWVPRIDRI